MHTCNGKDKVMHPSSAPIDPTELSNDDLNGGVHETTLGTITTIDCDENAQMIPLTAGDCFLPVIDIQGKEIAYEVFPNPTSNNVVVSFDSWENSILGKIVVFNSLGVEQFIHPKITQFNTLNFSDLNAGIYFIALVRETNEIQFLSTIQKN